MACPIVVGAEGDGVSRCIEVNQTNLEVAARQRQDRPVRCEPHVAYVGGGHFENMSQLAGFHFPDMKQRFAVATSGEVFFVAGPVESENARFTPRQRLERGHATGVPDGHLTIERADRHAIASPRPLGGFDGNDLIGELGDEAVFGRLKEPECAAAVTDGRGFSVRSPTARAIDPRPLAQRGNKPARVDFNHSFSKRTLGRAEQPPAVGRPSNARHISTEVRLIRNWHVGAGSRVPDAIQDIVRPCETTAVGRPGDHRVLRPIRLRLAQCFD